MRRLSCRFGLQLPLSADITRGADRFFQRCAVPLFRAYVLPLAQSITVNYKGLVNSIALAVELAPSAAWGEPLHVSGLFSVLVNDLSDDKVNCDFPYLKDGQF